MDKQLNLPFRQGAAPLAERAIRRESRRRLTAYYQGSGHVSMQTRVKADTAARLDLLRASVRRCATKRAGRRSAQSAAAFAASKEGRAMFARIERLSQSLHVMEMRACG